MTKAIFLDRDGTINPDGGYINHPDDFKLYPFTAKAIKKFNDMGYLVIVVTNQSGIARGYMTKEDLKKVATYFAIFIVFLPFLLACPFSLFVRRPI